MSVNPVPAAPPEKSATLRDLASALPDFALAVVCLLAWIAPEALTPGVVPWILLTMLVEFVVVHSAPFMGLQLVSDMPAARKLRNVVAIGLFYSVFLLGFSLAFHAWWPFVSFWLLTANRLTVLTFRQGREGRESATLKASWAAGALCYLGGVFLTTLLPLPRLGLDPAFVESLRLTGGGLWIEQPWRVLAFGAFYFATVGFLEATGFRALTPKPAR
ncbi:MAG: hypothetical protein HZA61_03735 [Candidatus Eisenbacteria bacterium]|uniref:Uncharacterized protein n=1 Tax=Eiseniibacteriota bacterium TaxID=2212470 RepID=A0A933SEM2_UNCEI|nr:hypothetical protein [Candidatus Eisenbacteria bacterium]